MSLPWEAEKITTAFTRAYSTTLEIIRQSNEVSFGINDTLSLLPFDFEKLGIFVPDKDRVRSQLLVKTARRLEKLMQELNTNLDSIGKHIIIMTTKIQELESNKDFNNPNVFSTYYEMKNNLNQILQEQQKLQKTAEVTYFS